MDYKLCAEGGAERVDALGRRGGDGGARRSECRSRIGAVQFAEPQRFSREITMRMLTRSCWTPVLLSLVFGWGNRMAAIPAADKQGNASWQLEEVPASWKQLPSGRYVSRGGFAWFS